MSKVRSADSADPGLTQALLRLGSLRVADRRPAADLLGHGLADVAYLDPTFLSEVARSLPRPWIRAQQVQDDPRAARNGVAPHPRAASAVRGDDAEPGYVVLYNLEHLAEFRELATALTEEVAALVGRREGGIGRLNLGAIVAPARSVVPAHPDQHHNVLLQIRGAKTVWVEAEPVRRRHDARVRRYYDCPTAATPDLPPAVRFDLGSADGVYIPPDTFHWVQVGDEPSVGLSVGFDTGRTRAVVAARRLDQSLRRRGLPAGGSAYPGGLTTSAKAAVVRVRRGG